MNKERLPTSRILKPAPRARSKGSDMSRLLSLVLLLTACAACDNSIGSGRYVWHIGDSTSSELPDRLSIGGWRPQGYAFLSLALRPGYALGRDLGYYTERLESARERAGNPDWVLIQLGSNDYRGECGECMALVDSPQELDAAVGTLLAFVPASARILWVMPGPGVPQSWRSHLRAGLERSSRRIELLELPANLYVDGIHFGIGTQESLDAGIAILTRLDQLNAGQL